jgi:ceramide glucosyltransferase
VLKPLKGCDGETEACLESWIHQDYPGPVQLLFGVSSADHPATTVVRRLIEQFPNRDLECVVISDLSGNNEKVAKLAQLEARARHDFLVISDADVQAPTSLLRQLAADWGGSNRTLVCCLYFLANPTTLAMQWEAVSINSDFWSQVLQAQSLAPLDFALGATLALHRTALRRLGGFNALVHQLADDFQLGQLVVRHGGEIRLASTVVECREAPRGWREVWRHQLRWARTIRVCRPGPYFLSILANGTLWPLLWLAAVAPGSPGGIGWEWPMAIGALLFRAATARDQQRKLSRGLVQPAPIWMPWFKDLAQVLVWAGAFTGNTVEWRGAKYRVRRNGELVRDSQIPKARQGETPSNSEI